MKRPAMLVLSAWFIAIAASAQQAIAPYSAQRVVERVQTLADGTRITQKPQKTNEFRDSAGRTRSEQVSTSDTGAEGITSINIVDPVAGFRYVLDPEAHTPRQVSLSKREAKATASVAPKQDERPEVSKDSLGTETIDGLLIKGTRTTTIFPAGSFGNDRPVTVVRENWVSPELLVVVVKKTSDPRTGEFSSRLTNISRSDPDPSLFQVPADYEVINGGASAVPIARRP
jgi:hypothetical protein